MHLTLQCCYAREVWHLFLGANSRMYNGVSSASSVSDWWKLLCTQRGAPARTEEEITLSAYIAWHLWKERNRRVFEDKDLTPRALVNMIRDDVTLLSEALRPTPTAEG
ncbi:hypothetical protein ACQJBY_019531 [Aegilops geniculata]